MAKAKYSLEFRVAVVEYYFSGKGGTTRTAAHFGIHKTTVSHWVASWQMHGIDGITWKIACYTPDFKVSVVKTVLREHLSCREAAVRFNVSDNKVVKRWLDIWKTAGEAGFQNRKRGYMKRVKQPHQTERYPEQPSRPDGELSPDEMMAELRYLRAEVDYLKKLKALAQKKKNH